MNYKDLDVIGSANDIQLGFYMEIWCVMWKQI